MKLSIIIPIYNGEEYLKSCLDSLVNQKRTDVEVLLINDGSTDRSEEVIRSNYNKEISNGFFKYRAIENQGVSAARNLGLDLAQGEYIGFVDCDDTVSPEYFETLIEGIKQAPCIVEFGYMTMTEQSTVINDNQFLHKKTGKHPIGRVINHTFGSGIWYSPIRIIHRDIIGADRYPLGVKFCEDLIFLSRLYDKANVIVCLRKVLYRYRINNDGATRVISPEYTAPMIAYYREIMDTHHFHYKFLKITLAYAIRRCISTTLGGLGQLPKDLELDVKSLIFDIRLYRFIGLRLFAFAAFGPTIFKLKLFLRYRNEI